MKRACVLPANLARSVRITRAALRGDWSFLELASLLIAGSVKMTVHGGRHPGLSQAAAASRRGQS
jgi:hypothetical protein